MKLIFSNGSLDLKLDDLKELSILFEYFNEEDSMEILKFTKESFIKIMNQDIIGDDIYEITELANYVSNTELLNKLCIEIKNKTLQYECGQQLMDFIEKYPDIPWDWEAISDNPNITMDIIEKYPDKLWEWKYISLNRNITMEFIEKYFDKPWDWKGISWNPNITIQ